MQCGQIFSRTSVHLHHHLDLTRESSSRQRLRLDYERQKAISVEIFVEEEIETTQDLYKKLSQETLPSEFTLLKSPKLSLVKLEATRGQGLEIEDDQVQFPTG
ncbi:unnamed protein product [Lepeophtheirus salmonis]|uniref:(salmon louse) hypothetical protein n=1 Tax=Lepeophtheirus salmonis TaxID=72036 RepID=A0A7R8H1A9_LEPSM|nr:unnamed protein product [Lepeophtheirus salmonis]CAF2806004.1 unnamed protein product [Lepeophtheirus salmonis]